MKEWIDWGGSVSPYGYFLRFMELERDLGVQDLEFERMKKYFSKAYELALERFQ